MVDLKIIFTHTNRMKEVEYKYLVDKELWAKVDKSEPQLIVQGFLHSSVEKTVRVRIKGEKAFLTIKGKTIGITRSEFEYEVPVSDAEKMFEEFINQKIRKKRYEVKVGKHTWEVDEFEGQLQDLVMAELEVESEDEQFNLPNWVTVNVSEDERYYNAVLIEKGIPS